MKPLLMAVSAVLLGGLLTSETSWRAAVRVAFSEEEIGRILQHSPLGPPPGDPTNAVANDMRAARLGQRIFFDTRFSGDRTIACAVCHNPYSGWSDGKVAPSVGLRHTPTLWNAAYNRWFFWDGRSDTQWSQALQPLENPLEHNGTRVQYARLVYQDIELRSAYQSIFGPMPRLSDTRRFPRAGRPIPSEPQHPHHVLWMSMASADQTAVNQVFANLGKAIAAFERQIVTRTSPFDRFVEGLRSRDPEKVAALPDAAQRGLKLFVGRGNCRLCHSGPNFTDGEFHNIRLPQRVGTTPDSGRYAGLAMLMANPFNADGNHSDDPNHSKLRFMVIQSHTWGQFKTPTLRNVALTAPYMHNGQFSNLQAVVRHYSTLENAAPPAHHEESLLVPLNLTASEVADLVAFLRSLTSENPPTLIDPEQGATNDGSPAH